ncbi:MAG: LicD family protein [Veillonella sp.]|nr:LicD family protein [Veillonella sp.]
MNEPIKGKELKSVLLKTLLRFNEFCTKNNIKYTIAYGTALGAIRHKGFIPWDDDIDVIMMRPEYEKFEKAWKQYILNSTDRYKLWPEMDEENYFMAFCAKFFDTETVLYEHFSKDFIGNGFNTFNGTLKSGINSYVNTTYLYLI